MAETTTIRIDETTHASLLEFSRTTGLSLSETVRAATEALGREHFARRVNQALVTLRTDPAAWNDYLAEAEATAVADGIS